MSTLWTTLLALIIGSALVPIQIVITILLLRNSRLTALAWVSGITVVRLLQGALFAFVMSSDDVGTSAGSSDGPGPVASTLLFVVAIVFFVTAMRQFIAGDDPDAPPPKWMSMIESITPLKAFLVGAGFMLIGVKFWVFTLGALAAIGDADLGQPNATIAFLVFVLLAASSHLALVASAYLAPASSAALLERGSNWLTDHNRVMMIVLGAVFGTYFMIQALDGFGVI